MGGRRRPGSEALVLTADQLAARAPLLGSSDAPPVLGLPAYGRTSADVWARITGRVLAGASRDTNETRSGRRLEGVVLDWAEERLGLTLVRDVMLRAPELPGDARRAANLDGWVPPSGPGGAPILVEAKSSADDDGWGQDGTDEVPDYVTAQTAHQALVCRAATGLLPDRIYVALILGRRGFDWRLYNLPVLPALISAVEAKEREWWRSYVETDTCPPEGPSLETIAVWRRMPGKLAEVAPDLVAAYREAADRASEAEKAKDAAKKTLLIAVGDAELFEAPGWRGSYETVERPEHVVKASSSRVLRVTAK